MAEKSPLQQMADVVAETQGQLLADQVMIDALVMSHPDPDRLRECWNLLSARRAGTNQLNIATKSRAADHALAFYLQDWSDRLDRYHPKKP